MVNQVHAAQQHSSLMFHIFFESTPWRIQQLYSQFDLLSHDLAFSRVGTLRKHL
jgi:hypothetical protein